MDTPVLMLVFNRPQQTRRVFEAVRQARPTRLYISADGARPTKAGESELCREVRAIFDAVDWPCEVFTRFRDQNFGCKEAVSDGISWFFDHEPEGIILEDDCLPHPTFFRFCQEMLARYRQSADVMMVSGNCFYPIAPDAQSYYFAQYTFIWGWASWRRAWQQYDKPMHDLPQVWAQQSAFDSILPDRQARAYLYEKLLACYDASINTWDYQWFYTIIKSGGKTILPNTNLVENIGFGEQSTHTSAQSSPLVKPAASMVFPLQHPQHEALISPSQSQQIFYTVYKSRAALLARRLKGLLRFGKK